MNQHTPFPQYRKLANGKALYKITSPDHFEEIQFIGAKKVFHEVKAQQYPEKLRIMDMLACADGLFMEISADEWELNAG